MVTMELYGVLVYSWHLCIKPCTSVPCGQATIKCGIMTVCPRIYIDIGFTLHVL